MSNSTRQSLAQFAYFAATDNDTDQTDDFESATAPAKGFSADQPTQVAASASVIQPTDDTNATSVEAVIVTDALIESLSEPETTTALTDDDLDTADDAETTTTTTLTCKGRFGGS